MNEIEIGDEIKNLRVKAIILNHGAYAYAKLRFDNITLDALADELHRIDNNLTKALVIRSMWMLVMDLKMSSITYLYIVLN